MDRARKVRKILPVSPCDIRGLEAWLEEQANAGLFPVSIGSWAVFTTDGVSAWSPMTGAGRLPRRSSRSCIEGRAGHMP